MKLKRMLLAVRDLQASVAFYKEVFGLRVVADFGANVTLTGGLSLQTLDTWEAFIGKEQVVFGGNDAEVYFEEDDFDAFLKKLKGPKSATCIRRWNSPGDSAPCACTIPTGMFWRSGKICAPSAAALYNRG